MTSHHPEKMFYIHAAALRLYANRLTRSKAPIAEQGAAFLREASVMYGLGSMAMCQFFGVRCSVKDALALQGEQLDEEEADG